MQTIFNPFVSSNIPDINPAANSDGILKNIKIGSIKSEKADKRCVVCNIDNITENSTTNPPINKMVLIELVMLLPIIPPKLEILISFVFFNFLYDIVCSNRCIFNY